jgi:hypothetical protein
MNIPGMNANMVKSVVIRFIYFAVFRRKYTAVGITAMCFAILLSQWQ